MLITGISVIPAFADINFGDYTNGTQLNLQNVYVSYTAPESYIDKVPTVCGDVLCGDSTPQDRIPIFQHVGILSDRASFVTNYAFALIELPTGLTYNNIVLSGDNATALKNNVGVFTACGSFVNGLCQPAQPTTAAVTNNYCPLALNILLNQGSYLNYTFVQLMNGTITKDLTHFVYPDYCLPETGQNPYSPIVVPTPIPQPVINSTNSTPVNPIPVPPAPTPSPVTNNTNSTPIKPVPTPVPETNNTELYFALGIIVALIVIAVVVIDLKAQNKI